MKCVELILYIDCRATFKLSTPLCPVLTVFTINTNVSRDARASVPATFISAKAVILTWVGCTLVHIYNYTTYIFNNLYGGWILIKSSVHSKVHKLNRVRFIIHLLWHSFVCHPCTLAYQHHKKMISVVRVQYVFKTTKIHYNYSIS